MVKVTLRLQTMILNLIMTATRYGRMTTNALIRSSLLSKLLVTPPLGVQLLLDKHTIHSTYYLQYSKNSKDIFWFDVGLI